MTDWQTRWQNQQQMLAHRLQKNRRRLKSWLHREKVSCYRVYDFDIPEIPLAIDIYHEYVHVSEYNRNHPYTEEEHQLWLECMQESICETLGVSYIHVFLKQRERQKGKSQYEKVSEESFRTQVVEAGHSFWVNLSDYLDTGLFLDHRITRGLVQREALGKRFLNLFAYTGSFTVYAAAGGATQTTTVDMSRTYLQWAQQNLELNHMAGPQHELIQSDVFAFLQEAKQQRKTFDLIVLDPPTFSTSKRMQGTLDIQRDHVGLLQQVLDLLAPHGVIYFSTNLRKFHLDTEAFLDLQITDITQQTIPPDFRSNIHQCWRIANLL